VLHDIAPGQQQILLRHERNATEQIGRVAAVAFEAKDATGVRLFQTRHDIEQRALAAAAGAHDRDKFAGGDARFEIRQRRYRSEGLGHRA
jgi:hypothetical protein